jgi:CRP-like cAMP-binding protein
MNIKPLLSYIQNFVELTKEEISFLKLNLTSRKYLKGQFVLQQGDVCKTSSFIIKGCTKMFYVDDDGQEHVIMLGIEDWWVSDIGSFINQTPSDFNIQCLEDTELIQFPFDRMEDIYLKIPKLERFFKVK